MKTYFSIDSFLPLGSSVVTLGAFDGLHLGHLSLIKKVIKKSLENKFTSILLSFYPHPRAALQNENNFLYLTPLLEKKQIIEKIGIEHFIIESFTKQLASLSPESFIKILVEKLHMKFLFVGYDHHLGHKREGGFENLKKLSKKYDFYLEEALPFKLEEKIVSSTEIKKSLLSSQIDWANKALIEPYKLYGKVIHGDKIGTKIGFPTANLDFDKSKFLPKSGVYAVKVFWQEKTYLGLLNLGIRPTFSKNELRVEVYLFDFDETIYNQEICVSFLSFIRQEKKFPSLEALKAQIKKDEKVAGLFFSSLDLKLK